MKNQEPDPRNQQIQEALDTLNGIRQTQNAQAAQAAINGKATFDATKVLFEEITRLKKENQSLQEQLNAAKNGEQERVREKPTIEPPPAKDKKPCPSTK